MQIPVLTNSTSDLIGPAYADSNYDVVFDGVSDDYAYQLGMNDGVIGWTSVSKTTGTYSGVKVTYRVPSTYTTLSNTTASVVTEGNTGASEFYLIVIK